MGAWGTAIFSNDTSADVRDEFRRHLLDGASAREATEKVIDDFGARDLSDPNNNDVWLGLASTQHSIGHIVPHVLATALILIESAEEIERWEQPQRARRASALRQLREKLQSEPPAPATFKPRKKRTTDFVPGHHLLYTSGESQLLFRVVGVFTDAGGQYPLFTVLDWHGDEAQLAEANLLPPIIRDMEGRPHFKFGTVGRKPKAQDLQRIEVLGPQETDGIGTWGPAFVPWKNVIEYVRLWAAQVPPTIR